MINYALKEAKSLGYKKLCLKTGNKEFFTAKEDGGISEMASISITRKPIYMSIRSLLVADPFNPLTYNDELNRSAVERLVRL